MAVDYHLEGQAAVVTGSTTGIGHAMAEALAQQGVNVVINGLGDPAVIEADRAAMAERTGAQVRYHGADMIRPSEIADLIAYAKSEFGRLDIVVNNAGIQFVSPVEDFPDDMWNAIIAINLSSAFHTTKHAVPIMKAQGRGRIINVASAHALVASPFKAAYVAAKHGIAGLTKCTAVELARTGITVNAICPGYVRTPLVEAQIADTARARNIAPERVIEDVMLASQPNKRFVEYENLNGLLLYLASDAGAGATGSIMSVDGGFTAQ